MANFNTEEFLSSIKSLEYKDLYFSGSEYSWASDDELDETYGEFVCSYDDFIDAVNDCVVGNNSGLCRLVKGKGADYETINKMVSNESGVIALEEIDD